MTRARKDQTPALTAAMFGVIGCVPDGCKVRSMYASSGEAGTTEWSIDLDVVDIDKVCGPLAARLKMTGESGLRKDDNSITLKSSNLTGAVSVCYNHTSEYTGPVYRLDVMTDDIELSYEDNRKCRNIYNRHGNSVYRNYSEGTYWTRTLDSALALKQVIEEYGGEAFHERVEEGGP